VYTDGSATDAVRDGGGGVYIEWTDGSTESHSIPTGSYSSNYKAEAKAIEAATLILLNNRNPITNIVFLTDAKSVLQALQKPQQPLIHNLISLLCDLNQKTASVVLQWVPGHCNIAGNETADALAKEGAKMTQITDNMDLSEAKTLTKSTIRNRWISSHPDYNKNDPYLYLQRSEQVTIQPQQTQTAYAHKTKGWRHTTMSVWPGSRKQPTCSAAMPPFPVPQNTDMAETNNTT